MRMRSSELSQARAVAAGLHQDSFVYAAPRQQLMKAWQKNPSLPGEQDWEQGKHSPRGA